jgi:hypothetical protein
MFKHMEVDMRTHLIIVALMLGAIACADRTAPTNSPLVSGPFAGPSSEDPESDAERPFRELARVAPSHGGWYFDAITGDLNVYLKDMSEGPAAKRALPAVFSEGLASARARHPHAGIVFKQGTYTFIELARWRDALDTFLGPPSVAWFGIHHAQNRIVIGVVAGADRQAIAAMAADLSIPAGALRFVKTTPIRFQSHLTLDDSIRPVKGGLRLERLLSSQIVFRCTLGFLALWGGEHAFVTNSHCSSQQWALDSTKWYQNRAPRTHPESLSISSIGFEVADSSTGCRAGFPGQFVPCSYADAAVYRATLPPGHWFFKRIARTVSGCFGSTCPPQPLTISDLTPFWSIVRTRTSIAENDLVSKIGQTTGWTQGLVRHINMKVFYPDGGVLQLQAFSDYVQGLGDSGAPVLLDILGGADTTVTLGGIHVGTTTFQDTVYSVFSPWSGILRMYPGLRVN